MTIPPEGHNSSSKRPSVEALHEPDQQTRDDAANTVGSWNPECVQQWYEQYARELQAFLWGVLKDQDLVSEAVQSTFIRALEAGQTVNPESVRGWLYKVALNEALGLRRKQATHRKAVQKIQQSVKPSEDNRPEWAVFSAERVEAVRAAINELPVEQQLIVRKRIYHEQTFAAIASELNLPLGTVLTRMRLALKRLADFFRQDHHE